MQCHWRHDHVRTNGRGESCYGVVFRTQDSVRRSSKWQITRWRITRGHTCTIEDIFSLSWWSIGGSTEWRKMCQDSPSKSGTPHRMLTRSPVTMTINSSELRTSGFNHKEVFPPTWQRENYIWWLTRSDYKEDLRSQVLRDYSLTSRPEFSVFTDPSPGRVPSFASVHHSPIVI